MAVAFRLRRVQNPAYRSAPNFFLGWAGIFGEMGKFAFTAGRGFSASFAGKMENS